MNSFRRFFSSVSLVALPASASPYFAPGDTVVYPDHPVGYTCLTMLLSTTDASPTPPAHVRIPPNESLMIQAPATWDSAIQWTKNGQPIAGATDPIFSVTFASSDNSGLYNLAGQSGSLVGAGVQVDVVPLGHLSNQSSRVDLAAGDSIAIVGFVVGGSVSKNLLIRAVGPTLASFGVANPVARPGIRLFDAHGQELVLAQPDASLDIPEFFRSLGAFQLGAQDSYIYGPFIPGVYTVHVSDRSQQGGTVLVEIYDMDP